MKSLFVLVAAIPVLLAACGGGTDSSSMDTGTIEGQTVKTGKYVDSAVSGLSYKTATQSGTTNANGEFSYIEGEEVTFTLYDQVLNKVHGKSIVTPFDSTEPLGNYQAVNVLRLLQTLDSDANPDNGIAIPVSSSKMNINFDQSFDSFAADANVTSMLPSGRILITAEDAVAHHSQTLGNIYSGQKVDFAGLTGKNIMTSRECGNMTAQGTFTFTSTGYSYKGQDFGLNCTLENYDDAEVAYSAYPDVPFSCGPTCDITQLNGYKSLVDHGMFLHYDPSMKKITATYYDPQGQYSRTDVIILQ